MTVLGGTMARKKMGRPKSNRQDVSVKFDEHLARKAKLIASDRGITMAEYLSELARPLIDRDYVKLVKKVEGSD
jgi:hypothetical protein